MTQSANEILFADPQDEAVDKGVVQGLSYSEVREGLGIEQTEISFTADAIRARHAAHRTHVDLYHVPLDPTQPTRTPEAAQAVHTSQQEIRGNIMPMRPPGAQQV